MPLFDSQSDEWYFSDTDIAEADDDLVREFFADYAYGLVTNESLQSKEVAELDEAQAISATRWVYFTLMDIYAPHVGYFAQHRR